MDTDDLQLVNERQAAQLLRVGESTLRGWRTAGAGPQHIRLSPKAIRYRLSDLRRWVDEHERRSTADDGRDGNV